MMKRNGAGRSSFLFGQQAEVRYQMLVSQAELQQARSGIRTYGRGGFAASLAVRLCLTVQIVLQSGCASSIKISRFGMPQACRKGAAEPEPQKDFLCKALTDPNH
jgi:hypothetical protein